MSDAHLSTLNPEQKRAVLHRSGPMLVLACAGTGKTRVATLRIAELIRSGIQPATILGVTFTNKAAQEMKERVEHLAQRRMASKIGSVGFEACGCFWGTCEMNPYASCQPLMWFRPLGLP